MIHTHTMSQLKTVQEPLKLLKSSVTPVATDNLNTVASFTLNIPQTAAPASSASAIVISSSALNYLKIIPVVKSTVTTPNIKITGWNKVINPAGTVIAYVPMCLFASSSMAVGANNITVNADAGFRVITTIAKAAGDAKLYSATGVNDTAFLLVDTLGCELIEIEFTGSVVTNGCNAFYGAM